MAKFRLTNKNNMSWFQLILLSIFGFFLTIGVLIFSGIIPGFRSITGTVAGDVVIWGSLPESYMHTITTDINKNNSSQFNLVYIEKPAGNMERLLVEALANGNGPDLILASQDLITKQQNKMWPIPYVNLSQRTFQDTFVDGAKVFADATGYLALPCYVDPLVFYFNKDLYTNAGIINYPKKWEEIVKEQPVLTKVDSRNNITQSAVAFGSFSNISNAKDILSMLIMQAGNPIVYDSGDFVREASLETSFGYSPSPAIAATDFFLQFSDPSKVTYSWNRALPEARDVFTDNKLANYFGLASELDTIRNKNPHLNFDVALVPQQAGDKRQTFGRFYGVAVLRSSKKLSSSASAAMMLASQTYAKKMSDALGVIPVQRAILASGTSDPIRTVFYDSALISRSWYDPDSVATANIFRGFLDEIIAGQSPTFQAISAANKKINLFFAK